MRRTKIVCTLGPAVYTESVMRDLIRAGMDVARINFSHGTYDMHDKAIEMVRRLAQEEDHLVAIMQDLQGPRIRTGEVTDESGQVMLVPGQEVMLTTEQVPSTPERISVQSVDLPHDVKPGDRILIDEGLLELQVVKTGDTDVLCRVITGGPLKAHKGINVPGVTLNVPTVTEKDLADLEFGMAHSVDFVALSFVRNAEDITKLKMRIAEHGSKAQVIAKIEKHEAVTNFGSILQASDGIMVARGDLAVETSPEEVPIVQKEVIRLCNLAGKPVITATQMLNSMITNPRPTRAEASDVANAIFDGTDAVMLSGETAVGAYPVETVKTMARIAVHAEEALPYAELLYKVRRDVAGTITEAVSQATVEAAYELNTQAIICLTESGYTARQVAKHRPYTPIWAMTSSVETARFLTLTWGVFPMVLERAEPVANESDTDARMRSALKLALDCNCVADGNLIVITAGVPLGSTTNVMRIHRVGDDL